MTAAVREAYEAGYLGKNILAPGSTWTSWFTRAPGRTSVARRRRCWTRWRVGGASLAEAPFPATAGLYAAPTVVNNVETSPAFRHRAGGSDWFRAMAPRKPRAEIYSLSGHWEAGQYEAPLGTTLRELLELAGGMKDGIR